MAILTFFPAVFWLLLSALFFAVGEYLSKLWGYSPSLRMTVSVVFIYALGTLAWLPALLHKNQLAVMGTWWLLLATLATISIGVLVFHEKVNTYQIAGFVLALIAIVFLNISSK